MKALTLRLPDDVYERLRREAFDKRVSLTSLILAGLTPTQPDRDQIELAVHQALMPEMMSLSLAIGSQEHYNELLARISGQVSALFNGGTKP